MPKNSSERFGCETTALELPGERYPDFHLSRIVNLDMNSTISHQFPGASHTQAELVPLTGCFHTNLI